MKSKIIYLIAFIFPLLANAQPSNNGGFSFGGFLNSIQGKIDSLTNGVNPMTSGVPIPREIPKEWLPNNALAVGSSHVLYLTKTGKVYGWGSNRMGQLAQGRSEGRGATGEEVVSYQNTDFLKPVVIPLENVIAVYAAGNASYALKPDGTVWAWGDKRYAGRGSYQEGSIQIVPAKIEGLPPIAKLAPWTRGVYAYDIEGKIWVWGNADQASMLQGLEFRSASSGTPIASRLGSPIDVRPSSYGNATYFLTSDGRLWNPSHMNDPISPFTFDIIFGDSAYTQTYIYGKTKDDKIYRWPEGAAERYSNGTAKHPMTLIERVGSPIDVARGNGFAAFMQADGSFIVWGGEAPMGGGFTPFLTGMDSAVNIPQAVKYKERIVAAKSHPLGIFFLTESGSVLNHGATGSNEIAMRKGNANGRTLTELVRPEQLPD